jgi:hypothetical protein
MWCVWGTGEVHIGFWWRDLMERDHLENATDWTALNQDKESLRTHVNAVMNLWVKHNAGIS